MKKRLFAVLASLCMVVSMVPTIAFAQDSGTTIGVSDLCEHHTEHTSDCDYTEGTPEQPCAHEHTDECYAIAGQCVHTAHDESCGGLADPTVCTHVCGEDTGCVIKTLNCQHQHDESCGYVPAAEGTPCTFVCEVCNAQDSGNPAAPSDAQPEECTCETLCTDEEINGDCPVCSAEGAELDKVCVGAALLLTAPTLRTGEIKLFIGGQQITESGCYENKNGTWIKVDGTEPANGQFSYDAATFTLTLNKAEITNNQTVNVAEGYTYDGSVIAFSQTADVSLKIVVSQGTSTITGKGGIRVESTTGNASLSIKGPGSLDVEPKGSNSGITLCSSKNTNLDIDGADVTASSPSLYGVYLLSDTATSTSTITVNNGSLTTGGNGNVGIYYYWPGTSNAGTSSLTVSGNAVVDTRNSQIMAQNKETVVQVGAGSDGNGGIVFNGKSGTVYGDVTLQEDLEIGNDETLTVGKDASLTVPEDVELTNNGKIDNSGKLTGTIKGNQPPKITTTDLPDGEVGEEYSQPLAADNNPTNWSITSGSLPTGVTLTGNTISGTPTAMDTYTFTVTATNDNGSDSKELSLTVSEPAPTTYTITVHASAGGTATADKTAAAEGETVTLTATPASGYHFDGWSVVSGTVTIQNNQFIMPAENVEIQAVFDRNSGSGGSGGSSYRDREYEFWMDVKEQIRDADPGDTIKVNARSYDRLPYSVMKLLGEQDDVTLRISWNDGDPIEIPSAFAANEPQRVYYPLEELAEMDFTQPAEPEADKPETETSAGTDATTGTTGDTSGSWTGGTVTQPAESQPEAEEPDTEPESEPETEPESEPTISEPDEETMTEPEWGELPMSWVLGGAVIVIAVGAGGFWFWKRRSQE